MKDVVHDNLIKLRDREGKLDDLLEKGETLEKGVSHCYSLVSPRTNNYYMEFTRLGQVPLL